MPCQVRHLRVSSHKVALLTSRAHSSRVQSVKTLAGCNKNSTEVLVVDKIMQSAVVPVSSCVQALMHGSRRFVSTVALNTASHQQQHILQRATLLKAQLAEMTPLQLDFSDPASQKNSIATDTPDFKLPASVEALPSSTPQIIELLPFTKHLIQLYNSSRNNEQINSELSNHSEPCIVDTCSKNLDGKTLDKFFGIDTEREGAVLMDKEKDNIFHSFQHVQFRIPESWTIESLRNNLTNYQSAESSDSQSNFNSILEYPHVKHEDICMLSPGSLGTDRGILLFSDGLPDSADQKQSSGKAKGDNKPTLDQLRNVQEHMTEHFPKILLKMHDYRVYKPEIIFENNFWETSYTTVGIAKYVVQISKLRAWAHLKFANVKMTVVKAASEEEHGCVRIQWRLAGIPQLRAFMFWKFIPGLYKKNMKKEAEWHDAISTFYVDGTGHIYKHRIDRMISDEEREIVRKPNFVMKLRAAFAPKPAMQGTACK